MLALVDIPLSVYKRALELYGESPDYNYITPEYALQSAESRIDVRTQYPGITPFAQAIAEYLSISGPWAEGGEYESDHDGYTMTTSGDRRRDD